MLRALALLSSVLAQAPAATPPAVDPKLPFVTTLHLENDVLVQSDRYYSNGIRLEHHGEYDACRELALALGFPDSVDHRYPCGGSLAQNMYTPSRIVPNEGELPWPDPNDRPYGGWLHGGLLFQHLAVDEEPTDSSRLTLQATVGVIGPPAGAGVVQREWHGALNNIFGHVVARIPVGWEAQLPTEPAFHVSALREQPLLWSRYVDATWSAGAMVGTVFTNASLGGTVRAGLLARPFGLAPIMPSVRKAKRAREEAEGKAPEVSSTPDVPERTFEAYLFARGQVRWVARNLFLDGTFFRKSISVRKTPFVGDTDFGFALRGSKFEFDLSFVFRSQEMAEPPDPRLSGHRFARLQLSYFH
ncbi:lipid A deacylase LpxR family protein [Hyalangium rubrum]|uniref:Lipid A deacylase LpxR family protein n=1 Tax=Hyalangium rubrum TaxID=3103134 RepID=A0ABU5HD68_9BACT|nr:lipid A deacylase LpxR family protein [Hyalangium sp. s54d21]MDY7231410.1 lipid A deacylase LpxR family protein [Hyalangium sp. s54d21]